jgi:hypothetical protein
VRRWRQPHRAPYPQFPPAPLSCEFRSAAEKTLDLQERFVSVVETSEYRSR